MIILKSFNRKLFIFYTSVGSLQPKPLYLCKRVKHNIKSAVKKKNEYVTNLLYLLNVPIDFDIPLCKMLFTEKIILYGFAISKANDEGKKLLK